MRRTATISLLAGRCRRRALGLLVVAVRAGDVDGIDISLDLGTHARWAVRASEDAFTANAHQPANVQDRGQRPVDARRATDVKLQKATHRTAEEIRPVHGAGGEGGRLGHGCGTSRD